MISGSHATLKGTGLSGYTQRNRAVARGQIETVFDTAAPTHSGITQLERSRLPADNIALAARLAEHKARRSIEVAVLEFAERLRGESVEEDLISAQCDEKRRLLLEEREIRARLVPQKERTAESFAAAFKIKKRD